jgi:hypothetical protein
VFAYLLRGLMVEYPASDFGTMFKKFLQDPTVSRVITRGIMQIQKDRRRAENERSQLLHLNNPPDIMSGQ